MSLLHETRLKLRHLLPDHCSVELPWIDLGGGEAGALHRLALRVLRDHDKDMEPRSLPLRVGRRAGAALWPANATLRSLAIWMRLGRKAEREFGVGLAAQLVGLLWAAHRHNIAPKAFYKYRLFEHGNRDRVVQFIQDHEIGVLARLIRRRYQRQAEQLDHKHEFWRYCVANDLPVIPVLGFGGPTQPPEWHIDELPLSDLVLKCTHFSSGEGFECWLYNGSEERWCHEQQQLDAEGLRAHIVAAMSEDSVIVQPRVSNHPALRTLSPRALSAVRVVTALGEDGQPYVAAAAMRAGVGESLLDNFGQGGVGVSVDPETGQVAPLCVMEEIGAGWVREHPDTGAVFGDACLPLWSEVRGVCLRAHRCIGDLPAIGWDIAITADGPMFVEANTLWSSELIQIGLPFPPELLRTLHRALLD